MADNPESALSSGLDPVLLFRKKLGFPYVKKQVGGVLGRALSLVGEGVTDGPTLESTVAMPCNIGRSAILIIGCGGTGSHLVPNLLQFIASKKLTSNDWEIPEIFLIDGDVVEDRNLIRQKFVLAEVGVNKARALATRLSGVWEIPISYYEGFVNEQNLSQLLDVNHRSKYDSLIIIGAVDNHSTRLEVHNFIKKVNVQRVFGSGTFWIDGGNEAYHGQAVLQACFDHRMRRRSSFGSWEEASIGAKIAPVDTPSILERHPEILSKIETPAEKTEAGCLELTEIDPQTIQANMMSAFCIVSLAIQIFQNEITSTAIYFDAKTGNTATRFLTKKNILEDQLLIESAKVKLETLNESLAAKLLECKLKEPTDKEMVEGDYW